MTNVFIALPLLLKNNVAFPVDHPTWANADIYGFADEFLWKANVDRAAQLVLLARLPEMALALLLACVVYAFTRSLFGEIAALFALFLCVFDPNILAHGHIVGTDLGVTLFLFSAVWVWTRALKRGSLRSGIDRRRAGGRGVVHQIFGGVARSDFAGDYCDLSGSARSLAGASEDVDRVGPRCIHGDLGHVRFLDWPDSRPALCQCLRRNIGNHWVRCANRVESGTPAFMLGQISPTGFRCIIRLCSW